jgi:hypothetical protein
MKERFLVAELANARKRPTKVKEKREGRNPRHVHVINFLIREKETSRPFEEKTFSVHFLSSPFLLLENLRYAFELGDCRCVDTQKKCLLNLHPRGIWKLVQGWLSM